MILSDKEILKEIKNKNILIRPFDRGCLGSNSYDVHLGEWLAVYKDEVLDAKKHNKVNYFSTKIIYFQLFAFNFLLTTIT